MKKVRHNFTTSGEEETPRWCLLIVVQQHFSAIILTAMIGGDMSRHHFCY